MDRPYPAPKKTFVLLALLSTSQSITALDGRFQRTIWGSSVILASWEADSIKSRTPLDDGFVTLPENFAMPPAKVNAFPNGKKK
jgi:hypothetical protein